ncbi:winged helix DNA-binding domain-containing protein [Mycobacterium sp. 236(2023)]|uniref:winged helix DNA-binding domain-containing protein n=1 Tax=Mycobacterium sp. 236(2023) TaxID=3038163 RepID=UPI002414D330|nr:winged helix DNA-binding domain-containing protein [Mycobacterium sp. 236(2023)]MDG4668764.1 winged helix DNA-binding domain-containing protein [Mycobacterium sp. 236(2023)]
MRTFTIDERRARLARRHQLVSGVDDADSVSALTAQLVGLHATDPATPHLSLWARLPGFTTADLTSALHDERSVVKHLAMRRTLWVVHPSDLPAIQSAASDRVAVNETRRLAADAQNAGVAPDGAAWLETACAAVLRHLGNEGPCTARQLREAVPELTGTYNPAPGKAYGGEGHLAPRVLTVLSARGHIVRGPNDGGWTTSRPRWVAAGDWLGHAEPVDPEKARAEMVSRWLYAFGPATVTDVKWWFGNTLGWARQSLADIGAVEVDLAGTPGFVLPGDDEPEPPTAPWCALLPGLDVTTMGWFDRDWYLGPHRSQVFDRNGNAGPTIWVDGRVVGAWRQDVDARVELALLENVGRQHTKVLKAKAQELTAWLDGVRINPRFPSPLSKGSP